jgi:Fic family protein
MPGVLMNSFRPGFIESQPISQSLLQSIRLIGEHKGQERLYEQQSPQVLEALRHEAIVESTESSNRLEGITAPRERLVGLAEKSVQPQNRPEQEIAGYRDVLATIHANHANMTFGQDLVRQLHRDLFQYTAVRGGEWKVTDNRITERRPDGTIAVRFEPVPAFMTAEAMEGLHRGFSAAWSENQIELLLVVSTYVFDFLCVHPFLDGNGRLSRLLTLLLLYKAGCGVGRFISLEKKVEETRESYYDALAKSSQGWHQGAHTLVPWWEYLMGVVVLSAYREFEARAGVITSRRGAQSQRVIQAVERLPVPFKVRDVAKMSPGVSRPTINRVLQGLRKEGRIRLLGKGRDAAWERVDQDSGR